MIDSVLPIAETVLQAACRDSRVDGEQQQASAALLAVLLAKSLVVLTDAMDAAAAAAGMTPAQLYAR
jgi:pyrroline-5-carboxylate reductase